MTEGKNESEYSPNSDGQWSISKDKERIKYLEQRIEVLTRHNADLMIERDMYDVRRREAIAICEERRLEIWDLKKQLGCARNSNTEWDRSREKEIASLIDRLNEVEQFLADHVRGESRT